MFEGSASLRQPGLHFADDSSANLKQLALEFFCQDSSAIGAHCRNVAALAQDFAAFLGYSAAEVAQFYYAGLFHDAGKMFIEGSILSKAGSLSTNEYRIIRLHPLMGYHFLSSVNASLLVRQAALMHHERLDGRGYPFGIAAQQIPPAVRLITICDAYEAMTSVRPYRKRMARAAALEELFYCRGMQFDKDLVDKFAEFVLGGPD